MSLEEVLNVRNSKLPMNPEHHSSLESGLYFELKNILRVCLETSPERCFGAKGRLLFVVVRVRRTNQK